MNVPSILMDALITVTTLLDRIRAVVEVVTDWPLINILAKVAKITVYTNTVIISFIIDIDECNENTDECGQQCNNTNGTYYCSCYPGYSLDTANRYSCNG